jgi:hypothetical protein
MKKQIVILSIILLLITIGLSGCELPEMKPDYITVNCSAQIFGVLLDKK